ncbi:MAG: fibronectin type III domain-containing protein [Oscillospiraceae bacterium]|nr:fibronectin type III domain-containing protein [Oscillospiraceae bacterium]
MENPIKKAIALLMALIFTFSAVTFVKNGGMTASAASASVSIKEAPVLKTAGVSTTAVKLTWSTTKNATAYRLYISSDNKKSWKGVVDTKNTTYTVSKLTAGKTYYFAVAAFSGKTKSPYSNKLAVTPKPQSVGSLKIKFASNTQAVVSWKQISGATGYELFLSTSSDFKTNNKKVTLKGNDKTSYTIKGMKNGTVYYVTVRAIVGSGTKKVNGVFGYTSQLITKSKTSYRYATQTVYATANVNIRKSPSTSSTAVGGLKKGQSIKRVAVGDNGWSKVSFNGTVAYIASNYLTTTKPTTTTTTKKATTTTKKQTTTKKETTTKKVTTTQKQTTTKASGSATQTSGGIPLKPITSSTAKAIAKGWSATYVSNSYEGKSADGKTIVVYVKTSGGWTGKGSDGAYYNASGQRLKCEYCGKVYGSGPNMCMNECVMSFN